MNARPGPPVRATARALTLGTLASAACFAIGFALAAAGVDRSSGDALRPDIVLSSAAALRPWGWSMLGVLVLLITPALGLVVSVIELRRDQPRTALLALGVLAILAAATAVALTAS